MTEPAPTPDDEQPTGSFEPVAADQELPPPGAPADASGGDVVAQIERLAQDRPEARAGPFSCADLARGEGDARRRRVPHWAAHAAFENNLNKVCE